MTAAAAHLSSGVPVLRTIALSRSFGGLTAVDKVSIDCRRGEVHAIIGPNGAGKTTLVNLLSGELRADEGEIHLFGNDVTGLSADVISRRGVGRSYQKTNIFPRFSAFENCRLAAQARLAPGWRLLRRAERFDEVNARARAALEETGLGGTADRPAFALSHGEQRQLEIAMTLATDPGVLLLDEPLAGTGAAESQALVELIGRLRSRLAVLLIEHDMDAVFALADRLTVMVNGVVLASGRPEQIRRNAEVRRAYLGDGSEPAGSAA